LGLVAALTLISNFLEMVSDTGSDRFLVQTRSGDRPALQKLVQLSFVIRGSVMALGFALLAWPVAAAFDAPALGPALLAMGLVPMIGGLLHLDIRRVQRDQDFRAEGWATTASELVGLAATIAAAFVVRDFTAVVYGLVARAATLVLMSHLTASRRYEIGDSKRHRGRLIAFALPLMVNGVLMFAAGQSDRLMISVMEGLEPLGVYTAVLLLALYPSVALSRFFQGIHLPIIAKSSASTTRGAPVEMLAGRSVVAAAVIVVGFAIAGPTAVAVLFGPEFSQASWLIGLIGMLQGLRFLRVWPTTMALAIGLSRIVLTNNVARLVGIPIAFIAHGALGGIGAIVAGFVAGELSALIAGALTISRARRVSPVRDLLRILAVALLGGCVVGAAAAWPDHLAAAACLTMAGLTIIAVIGWSERLALAHAGSLIGRAMRGAHRGK
jgi:O-antigen/teichoic acid export membrane protein